MIIDAHVHLVTARMIENAKKRFDRVRPGLFEKTRRDGKKFISPELVKFLRKTGVKGLAGMWEEELDRNGIERALFLPIGGELSDLEEFISLNPARFSGYVFLKNPPAKSASRELERLARTGLFKGLKLYPALQGFSAADKRMFPVYEAAGRLGVPVLFHFGITQAPVADYRYTNPMDLRLPLKMFPETNFIIAHFGAGFFREVLLLGFHSENLYVDTSGTNNWRLYTPGKPPLSKVFRRTIEVFGAEKIIFGTDSAISGESGYRSHILKEQKKVLAALKLPKKKQALVMGGTARRLFRLDEAPDA
ncbi:MAG: amidohydrolase family protein [Candidatus Nitrospinota bacterium M3_3B_026]